MKTTNFQYCTCIHVLYSRSSTNWFVAPNHLPTGASSDRPWMENRQDVFQEGNSVDLSTAACFRCKDAEGQELDKTSIELLGFCWFFPSISAHLFYFLGWVGRPESQNSRKICYGRYVKIAFIITLQYIVDLKYKLLMGGGRARDKRVIPKVAKLGKHSYPEQFALGDAEISYCRWCRDTSIPKCFECSLFFWVRQHENLCACMFSSSFPCYSDMHGLQDDLGWNISSALIRSESSVIVFAQVQGTAS